MSLAQLSVGLGGMAVAVKRRHAYHFLVIRGRHDKVVRDAFSMGTALSAPAPMLVAQGVAAARLMRGSTDRDRLVLGTLGAAMVAGYLGESLVRMRLQPSSWDPVDSPIAAAGLGLAALMATVAFCPSI